jgi:hypothetical protein
MNKPGRFCEGTDSKGDSEAVDCESESLGEIVFFFLRVASPCFDWSWRKPCRIGKIVQYGWIMAELQHEGKAVWLANKKVRSRLGRSEKS